MIKMDFRFRVLHIAVFNIQGIGNDEIECCLELKSKKVGLRRGYS